LRPRHRETSRISYGIKIGEVRIWSPTPAMIIVGVTASPLRSDVCNSLLL